jgi:hypothetical protein
MALSRGVQRLSSQIARKVNRLLGRRGRFFSDRFHSRVIKTPRDMRNVLSYVLLNRHKDLARAGVWVRGLDPCSSGRYFDGFKDVKAVLLGSGAERAPPVARPRSWLLGKGWRRHGLLRTDERTARLPDWVIAAPSR